MHSFYVNMIALKSSYSVYYNTGIACGISVFHIRLQYQLLCLLILPA